VIDLNTSSDVLAGISASSFQFAVWSDFGTTGTPIAIPNFVTRTPIVGTDIAVSTIPGGGANGTGRVKIVFRDSYIQNGWLSITVLSSATGLAANDVFYFGNARYDVGNTISANGVQVTSGDWTQIRATLSNVPNVSSRFDVDRSGSVTSGDWTQTRAFVSTSVFLRSFVPGVGARASVGLAVPEIVSPGVIKKTAAIAADKFFTEYR